MLFLATTFLAIVIYIFFVRPTKLAQSFANHVNAKEYREADKFCSASEKQSLANQAHVLVPMGRLEESLANYEEAEAAYKRMVKNVSDPATRLVLESNYCQLLADTGRLSECRERLVAVEDALRTAKRIAPSINAALESAIQNVRSSLEKQSEPENTNDVRDNMSQI